MGKLRSSDTRIFLDAHDLSGDLNAGQQTIDQPSIDVRCYSDPGPASLVDYYSTSDDWSGFFSRNPPGGPMIDQILNALVGDEQDHYLLKLFQGSTENGIAYETVVRLNTDPLTSRDGQAVAAGATFEGSGPCYRGRVLRAGTLSAIGWGTGRNLGATLAGETFAVTYRVLGGTFTTLTLDTQQSSDDGAGDPYAAIAGMSHVFTGAGAVRVTTTLATEAWKRSGLTAFTGTSALVLVSAGKVANFI